MNLPIQMGRVLTPQQGFQERFAACPADICIAGAAAGVGKTYSLLLEAGRHVSNKEFHAVIFRRDRTDIRKAGGIWDEAQNLYLSGGAKKAQKQDLRFVFKDTVDISFDGLQYEDTKLKYQGAQLDFIGFDELTHFTESQFWYLFSRLRSRSGEIKPYIRATCNPEPGWVYELIRWWIDDDGFAIKEREGVLRWFVRESNKFVWFGNKADADKFCNDISRDMPNATITPTSLTFIPGSLNDNKELQRTNPHYISTLYSLPEVEKQRLLHGNWKVKPAGKLFNVADFVTFAVAPSHPEVTIITVDTAQETKSANDYTVMQAWCRYDKRIYLLDQMRGKYDFEEQFTILSAFAVKYKPRYIAIEKKANGSALIQMLRKTVTYPVRPIERIKDKYTRGYDCQGYIESGYVCVNNFANYYLDFTNEVRSFAPENKGLDFHDDQVDCMMDAIDLLLINYADVTKPKVVPNAVKRHTYFGGMNENIKDARASFEEPFTGFKR